MVACRIFKDIGQTNFANNSELELNFRRALNLNRFVETKSKFPSAPGMVTQET